MDVPRPLMTVRSDDQGSEDRGPSLALDVDAGRLSSSEQKTSVYLSVVKNKKGF